MPDNQDARATRVARFTRYGWGVLAYNLLAILWGAYVRNVGLTHRTTSGLALAAVVLLMVWARRLFAPGSPTRRAAHAATVLMITEALFGVGAWLVLFEMVADNDSLARGYWLAAHLFSRFLLIAALTLVPWFASGHRAPAIRGGGRSVALLGLSLAGLLLLGMTGAVTALGATLRVIHPILAVLVGGLILLTAGVVSRDHPSRTTQDLGLGLAVLVAAQMMAGLMNLMLMAPVWMQLVHLLLAVVLWMVLVVFGASALRPTD